MSDTSVSLPPAFADLAPFGDWVLPTERERYNKRIASSMAELQAFYDALLPRLEEAVEYLETVPYDDDMSEADINLLWMCCSLCTASFPVEAWRQPRVPDSGAATFDAIFEPAI
jgi:hypothetical protein